MPPEFLASGVFVDEVSVGSTPIPGAPTSITVLIGWTAKGPVDQALLVTSFKEFVLSYGGLDQRSELSYAIKHFFENGGSRVYPIRIAENRVWTDRLSRGSEVLKPNTSAFERHFPEDAAGGVFAQLDKLESFNILAVPGETSSAVIARLQAYCRKRRAFYIVDSPGNATVENMKQGPDKEITGPDAMNSALYFPWLVAPDPLQQGKSRHFPPSGFVAGIYARNDVERGIQKAPAGVSSAVRGATGVSPDITDTECNALSLLGINCIRDLPNGITVWGARTLLGGEQMSSEWKYVPVRRLALFLEESIERGLQWTVFEPNGEQLWKKILLQVDEFLYGLWREGALQGNTSREAYFVKCGSETMTQNDIDSGRINCLVGIAAVKPAEFVIIRIQLFIGNQQD